MSDPKCGVVGSTLVLKSPMVCPWYISELGMKSEIAICSMEFWLAVGGRAKSTGPNGVPPRPLNDTSPLLSTSTP